MMEPIESILAHLSRYQQNRYLFAAEEWQARKGHVELHKIAKRNHCNTDLLSRVIQFILLDKYSLTNIHNLQTPKITSEMKRIYISGPISNIPHERAFEAFEDAENKLRARGYEPVNPMKLPHDHDKTWSAYMREDIIALMGCDAICTLYGWEMSKGAKIEVELATALHMEVRHIYSHSFAMENHG